MLKKILKKFEIKPSVCYYSHVTQKGKHVTKIYLRGNLNKLELKHNISSRPNIITILHGKKMFFRFLKNNNFFGTYTHYIRTNVYEIPCVDFIVQENFTQPFAYHIRKLCNKIKFAQTYNDNGIEVRKFINDVKTMYKLSDEWTKILTSINFANNENK